MIRRLLFLAALAACALPLAAMAQDEAASFRAQNARVFNGTGAAALTLPSQASPPAVVADFLRGEGYAPETVDSLILESEHTVERTGLTHLRFAQQVGGLTVHGAYVKAAVSEDGELVHLIEALAPAGGRGLLPSIIDPRDALNAALEATHPGVDVTLRRAGGGNTIAFTGDDFFHRDPTVTRVAIAMESGILQEGYLVETWTEDENLLHHTLVGGNGRVLDVELRTNNESYNIFPDHPGNSTQTIVYDPSTDPIYENSSPSGWLFGGAHKSISISGNNVHAYLDSDNSNSADAGGTNVSDGDFLATANLSEEPTTETNQDVAVQNLFYLNNVIHDKLYVHGFVEAVGNFQEDNFGNGGFGSDSVNAEAQDGGGTDNANFATPTDGSNPRMQMYLWTQSTPGRDGDLDSDIVYHEYCHGLTWRMIDGMSGPMSGAIGEGMSDGCSILMNANDVVGEYSYNDPGGIRSREYTGYETYRTYGDFTGDSVHFDGEIYAAIIWDLKGRFEANSIALDTLWHYIVGGMNFTSSGPAFEDMRDGILAATPASDDCLIWESFAKFGVGVNANSSEDRRGPIVIIGYTVNEDFTVPSECTSSEPNEAPVVLTPISDQTVDEDSAFSLDSSVHFDDPDDQPQALSYSVSGPSWLSIDSSTGVLSGTPTNADVGSSNVTVTANDGQDSVSETFVMTVNNTNDAPELVEPIVDQTAIVDTAFSLDVSRNFDDVDAGDTLTYSVSGPVWLSINSSTGVLSGTPKSSDVGSTDVTVSASDGQASASDTFGVTVSDASATLSVNGISAASGTCGEGSTLTMLAGNSVSATICGTGFAQGASVSFENGSGPSPEALSVEVAAGGATISLIISTKAGGPPGTREWDIRVTNPDSSTDVLPGGLIVTR